MSIIQTIYVEILFLISVLLILISSIKLIYIKDLFYDDYNKGTFLGKAYFSYWLCFILYIPIKNFGLDNIVNIYLFVFFVIVFYEIYKSKNNKLSLYGINMILLSFYGFYIFPKTFLNPNQILLTIFVCISVDTLANVIGKRLKVFRLQIPKCITKNKSGTAFILAILITTFVYFVILACLKIEYDIFFVLIAGIGTAIGDLLFSHYKRSVKIKDFPNTLGPIGGLVDRVDGWIIALILVSIYSSF